MLNSSYLSATCLIDSHVMNTPEYQSAKLAHRPLPHFAENPAGACTAPHIVRNRTHQEHREPPRAAGLEAPGAQGGNTALYMPGDSAIQHMNVKELIDFMDSAGLPKCPKCSKSELRKRVADKRDALRTEMMTPATGQR